MMDGACRRRHHGHRKAVTLAVQVGGQGGRIPYCQSGWSWLGPWRGRRWCGRQRLAGGVGARQSIGRLEREQREEVRVGRRGEERAASAGQHTWAGAQCRAWADWWCWWSSPPEVQLAAVQSVHQVLSVRSGPLSRLAGPRARARDSGAMTPRLIPRP